MAAVAGTGMIIAAIYLLYMCGKVVWGPVVLPPGHEAHGHGDGHGHGHGGHAPAHGGHGAHSAAASHHSALPTDLNAREIGILVPLAMGCIVLGVYPSPFLRAIQEPVSLTSTVVIDGAQLERNRRAAAEAQPADVEMLEVRR
jgi:NADH-quinone oxidoreductase subunit M